MRESIVEAFHAESNWKYVPAKRLFHSIKKINVGLIEINRLALTMKGVINRSINDSEGLQSADYSVYQIFEKDDLVFKLIDLENIKTSRVGIVHEKGIMSPAYIRLCKSSDDTFPRFYYWYFFALYLNNIFNKLGGGIRQNLTPKELLEVPVPSITKESQVAIANFLDRETARIDNLIAEKQTFIKLLKEKRQALISHVVTKGLDPTVKMKDSGIEWIGEIPEHWEICKISYRYEILLGKMLDEKKITGDHLSYYLRNTDVQWDKINSENLPQMDFRPEEIDRYQVRKGDLLVCEGGEIGRCAVWDRDKPCFYQKALHRVRPYSQNKDCTRFLFYAISDAVNQERFVSRANKATIAHLPAESFRQYRFAFPDYDEQLEIAKYLDGKKKKFDQLLKETEKSVRLLLEHRSALISAAVTGKIDVRHYKEGAT